MSRKLHALTTTIALLATGTLAANDIQIGNASLVDNDNGTGTVMVQFDVSWENSWRTNTGPSNWDAAWLFVKFRTAGGEWQHARLEGTGHVAPSGTTIDAGLLTPGSGFNITTNPAVGVFLYRSAVSSGSLSANGTKLKWNYAANGVTYGDIAQVQVFGIEMVYVADAAFYLGSSGTAGFTDGSGSGIPYLVSSEGAIPVAQTAGSLWTNNGSFGFSSVPSAFPKGKAAFYCMKYEISQQGYVDFLNTLARAQQATRTRANLAVGQTSTSQFYVMSASSTIQDRNGIRCPNSFDGSAPITFYCSGNGNGVGGEADDGQWVACNYLEWDDVIAYLDWSGLRPLTELEYEKACRGTAAVVPNEGAWGSTYDLGLCSVSNAGTKDETSNTVGANCHFAENACINPFVGPVRVGLFATASSDRQSSGAGFYGAMDLSGNVMEQVVEVGSSYSGAHGDGLLSSTGDQNVSSWPIMGDIRRGGSWAQSNVRFTVRSFPGVDESELGGRGVRTAP